MSEKLVEVIRGNVVESVHRGSIIVVKDDGTILHQLGDPDSVFFMRSSGKPLQAVAALEAGVAEAYNLDLKEIAVSLSSHSGEKDHIKVLESLMKKVGIEENTLGCGVHNPLGENAYRELLAEGGKARTLHCNCSGKHIAVIAACKLRGFPLDEYYSMEHPCQKEIIGILTEFGRIGAAYIKKGTDGCGMPVYGMPLRNIAIAYANLANEKFSNGRYSKSQNYVISSMTMHPDMVAGNGRIDTELMRYFGDRLICKSGSEGLFCLGFLGKGTAMVVKIEDGNQRAVGPAVIEALLQLKAVEGDLPDALKELWNPPVKTHNGIRVGEIRADFKLS